MVKQTVTAHPLANSNEAGFSTLETIIAMTVMALLLGMATQSLVISARSIAIAKSQIESAHEIRVVVALYTDSIRRDDNGVPIEASGWILQSRSLAETSGMTAIVIQRGRDPGVAAQKPYLMFLPQDAGVHR